MNTIRNRPCPACGGDDRFYLVPHPRTGGPPFWRCNQCPYTERYAGDLSSDPFVASAAAPPARSVDELNDVQDAYGVVARRCVETLWARDGTSARTYLHGRGLEPDTIRALGFGYCPDGEQLMRELWRTDERAYWGAYLGGLRKRQGIPYAVLRGTITIPYWSDGRCVLLRGRKLHPQPGWPTYLSPAGPLFASGAPRFYLHDLLHGADGILLTEGELKAAAAYQAWRAGDSPMPCIATCGVGYLPDALIAHLRGKTVYLVFDNEAPKPGERLSPAEQAILRHGPRLRRQNVTTRVVTLPRPAGVQKVDLDSYLRTTHEVAS